MTEEKEKEQSGEISRREFLKDAGLVVGGAAIGSTVLLAACGEGEVTTETVTETTTETVTETETVSKFVCPFDGQEFDTLDALTAHIETAHPGEVETITKFVCPSCNQEFASLASLQSHFEAEHPAEPVPEKLTKLIVNGDTYELKVEPNRTLAEVLRGNLGLTGTKIFCNLGSCGFCNVIVDNKLVRSCLMLAVECDGKEVLTIEGLAEGEKLHPIQEAFIEHNAYQCGTCTPGVIMTAKALLDKNPNPTFEEIQEGMAGAWCRCSAYAQIFKAVQSVAAG